MEETVSKLRDGGILIGDDMSTTSRWALRHRQNLPKFPVMFLNRGVIGFNVAGFESLRLAAGGLRHTRAPFKNIEILSVQAF